MITNGLWQDVRYGLRGLLKRPLFTVVAVLTLALGIGANTAIFSVVNAVLLRNLPYPHAERLAVLWESVGGEPAPVSYPNFLDWREQNRSFEKIAAYSLSEFNLAGNSRTERVLGEEVSEDYFAVLGIQPSLGRTFLPEESGASSHPVAVLSYALWQRRFGSDAGILGRNMKLNGQDYKIIGVMPKGFRGFSLQSEAWLPLMLHDLASPDTARYDFLHTRDIHWLRALGRLKPDVTSQQSQTDLQTIAARLVKAYPQANNGRSAMVIEARTALVSDVRSPLLLLLGVVCFLLLIGCANVANLLLVRSAGRGKEIGLRIALGASGWRIIRQLLTESILISLAGGMLGLLLALWGINALLLVLPLKLPAFAIVSLDRPVLLYTLLVSMISGIALGLPPALQISRRNLVDTLKEGGQSGQSRAKHRLHGALVVGEVALAFSLMIGAGLLLRSFWNLQKLDPGFKPEQLLTMRLDVPIPRYQGEAMTALDRTLVSRLESVPEVTSAALTTSDPLLSAGISRGYSIQGRSQLSAAEQDTVYFQYISPGFFHTMGIPLIGGRDVTEHDNSKAPGVVIVSESFAWRYWPGENAIGKKIKYGPADSPRPWMEVVGVVGNTRLRSLFQDPESEAIVYSPLEQSDAEGSFSIVVRTKSNSAATLETLRKQIETVDPDIPVYSTATLQERISGDAANTRGLASLTGVFAILGMLLSGLGVYGVMAYSARQRSIEIGIRMALGARRQDIVRLLVGHGILLAMMGLCGGGLLAFLLTRTITRLFFGVSSLDPATYGTLGFLLAGLVLLASLLPATRASRLDPSVALKYE